MLEIKEIQDKILFIDIIQVDIYTIITNWNLILIEKKLIKGNHKNKNKNSLKQVFLR